MNDPADSREVSVSSRRMFRAQHPRGAKPQHGALIYASYVRIAYFAHTSRIRRCASRGAVTLEWKRTGKRKEIGYAATKERKRECKGRFQVGAPFVVGRCFRLCRPCWLINNTISPFLRVFLSFSAPLLPPPTRVFCLPCPGDTWPLASLINNT